ncbi:hypothetical protein GCM10025861_16510 [Methanobacterium petrolearium]|nr:hypothetical protein GCM10025861_16510 [Methanobacterium petrolearium]
MNDNMTNKTDKLCMPTTSLSDYSIVLIELFEKNDFESLIASLNKLYGSYCENPHFKIYDDPNKTFENGLGFIGLPDLVKEFITSDNKVYYNFGEYIKNVKVDFVHLTPSIAILKFHIFLKDDFSKKIIEILDKRNMQYSKPPNSDNKMMKWILHHRTDMLKTTGALMEFKTSVNEDILEFLEEFNGFFYKVYENDFSIFPTIDIFHLDWPDDTEELNEWIMDNFAFLASINALTPT